MARIIIFELYRCLPHSNLATAHKIERFLALLFLGAFFLHFVPNQYIFDRFFRSPAQKQFCHVLAFFLLTLVNIYDVIAALTKPFIAGKRRGGKKQGRIATKLRGSDPCPDKWKIGMGAANLTGAIMLFNDYLMKLLNSNIIFGNLALEGSIFFVLSVAAAIVGQAFWQPPLLKAKNIAQLASTAASNTNDDPESGSDVHHPTSTHSASSSGGSAGGGINLDLVTSPLDTATQSTAHLTLIALISILIASLLLSIVAFLQSKRALLSPPTIVLITRLHSFSSSLFLFAALVYYKRVTFLQYIDLAIDRSENIEVQEPKQEARANGPINAAIAAMFSGGSSKNIKTSKASKGKKYIQESGESDNSDQDVPEISKSSGKKSRK